VKDILRYVPSKVNPEILRELSFACSKYGPFHSGHEGYATILEELDELWGQHD
jgi:hypothetical protein